MSPFLTAQVLLLAVITRSSNAAYAGPYIVYADYFYRCGENETTGKIDMHATITPFNKKKVNELQRMTGNFTISDTHGVDNTYWSRARVDQKRPTGWKENVININRPSGACSGLRENVPDLWRIFVGQDPGAMVNPCTTKAKWTSTFVDEPINWTFTKIPVLPYGHWRFNIKMGRARETLWCFNAEGHSIPKVSTRA